MEKGASEEGRLPNRRVIEICRWQEEDEGEVSSRGKLLSFTLRVTRSHG